MRLIMADYEANYELLEALAHSLKNMRRSQ